jgi:hypothetical protein
LNFINYIFGAANPASWTEGRKKRHHAAERTPAVQRVKKALKQKAAFFKRAKQPLRVGKSSRFSASGLIGFFITLSFSHTKFRQHRATLLSAIIFEQVRKK